MRKINSYQSITIEEANQSRIKKQPKFIYFSVEKVLEKEIITMKDLGEQQSKALQSLESSKKMNELKQKESTLAQNQINLRKPNNYKMFSY